MKLVSVLFLTAFNLCAFSQTNSWEIPFQPEGNCIYIYCKVNETDSLRFLFDTGADGSVINTDSNKKPHLKTDSQSINQGSNGSDTVFRSNGNKISCSGLEQMNIPLTLIPFGTADFDGVFGTDLMKNYIVEINYDRKVLQFYEANHFKKDLSTYDKIRIHFVDGYPAINTTLTIQEKNTADYSV